MAQGYLVWLGNGVLGTGDRILDPYVTFDVASTLGTGNWSWNGHDGTSFQNNQSGSGTYYVSTTGDVYFSPDSGPVDSISVATVSSAPSYTAPAETVGSPDDDTLNGTASAETIRGLDGNDTINAGDGADTVEGGGGNDVINGGDGADEIYGDWDGTQAEVKEVISWDAVGSDEQDVSAGLSFSTGNMDVTVNFTDDGAAGEISLEETDVTYGGGASGPFDTTGSLFLQGLGGSAVSTTTIDFAAGAGSEYSDEVGNVSFRINDVDSQGWVDVITVNAFDAAGQPVAVTITPEDADNSVSGNTVTSSLANTSESSQDGSVLFEIEGPVQQIEIIYENGGTGNQWVWMSEVHFEPLLPEAGDDTIDAGAGDDFVEGGLGDDSIQGGADDDTIYGDFTELAPVSEAINWTTVGVDEQDINGGFAFTTGETAVNISIEEQAGFSEASIEDDSQIYVATGEPFNDQSAVYLRGDGGGAQVSTTTIDFSAVEGSNYTGEAENVQFRISDIDTSSFIDIVTVNAYDADGNVVPVQITTNSTAQNVSGNTVTSSLANVSPNNANGSVLFEIAGPVSSIEIIYENGGTNAQAVFLSDIHFDTVLPDGGDDTLEGGTGADTMYGGDGDDTFYVGANDEAYGGDGDDTFILTDAVGSGGTIFIQGAEGDEDSGGDTLALGGLAQPTDITYTNTDDNNGGLSGTVTLSNGSVVTFENIENIICFTPGTLIQTIAGPRRIEDLEAGDMVVTRDHGAQPIRWIGSRTVPATGAFAPIEIAPSVMNGADAPLRVSPQHRMLFEGYKAELLFGESEVLVPATHLVNDLDVVRREGGLVTYIHLMFDAHQIIYANGAATESFFAADQGLSAVSDAAREELFAIFPELRSNPGHFGPLARRSLRKHEALLLTQ